MLSIDGQPAREPFVLEATRQPAGAEFGDAPPGSTVLNVVIDAGGTFLHFEALPVTGTTIGNGFGVSGVRLHTLVLDGHRLGDPPEEVRADCTEPMLYIEGMFTRADDEWVEGEFQVQGNRNDPVDSTRCGSSWATITFSAPVR